MGKYDKEREELGLSSTSSSSTTSKYAAERNRLLNSAQASKDDRKSYVEGMSAYRDIQLSEQKKVNEKNRESTWSAMDERGAALLKKAEKDKAEKAKINDVVYGKTDKVKSSLSGVTPVVSPKVTIPAIAKVKEQADRLKVANEASTKAVMAAQKEEEAANKKWREDTYKSEPPIIRDIHRGLDNFALSKPIKAFDEFALENYTPGAGLSVLNSATQSASNLVGKAAPFLAKTLGLRGGRIAQTAISESIVGAPTAVGNVLAKNPEANNRELLEGAAYGAGGGAVLGGLGRGVVEGLDVGTRSVLKQFFDNSANQGRTIETAMRTTPSLELPAPTPRSYSGGVGRPVETPDIIYGEGKVEPLGLPSGNPVQRTRYTVAGNNQALNRVMTDIKPEVEAIITPPTRRDQLINYIQQHLGIPKQEIWNMPMKDLQELGAGIRQNMDVPKIAIEVARKRGHDLPSLLDGNNPSVGQRVAQDAQERAYGVYPDQLPNVKTPQFARQTTNGLAMPVERVGRAPKINSQPLSTPRASAPIVSPARPRVDVTPNVAPTRLSDLRTNPEPIRTNNPVQTDELKFAQTVKDSPNTAQSLIDKLNEAPMVGARTTDVLNRQQAANLIERHGMEGLFSKLMGKTKQFSASENTAAQILAKHYSSLGGEENLSKAIDLVSKTARGGREMGQAIQALSQWNKLDVEGALLLGERQLNKGVPTEEWQKLTVAQGKPLTEAAQRIGSAQETRSLADEVLSIVTNKQAGQALTDAEKATIKQFQDQVKLINEKGKGILSKPKANKVNETINEVSQIEPKERTRDQVVNFLDAKAEKARQRLAKSRNIGALPDLSNPIVDYAIIGASKIAKGAVKLSDFSEQMIKDFGSKIKPHINEVFTKATNIFRKENGLPTVEQLDRVVNNAVKNERFTAEEAKQFKAWASEIGHMSDEFKREATQDLQAAMKELGDSTLGQKLSTLQTGSMLLNNVTLERNVIGNVTQLISEKVIKVATVPIDWATSKLTGERTIRFKTMNQEKFWQNFFIGTKSGWRGVSPNGVLDSYGIHPNVFGKKNPFKYISKLLGASLQGFDHAFYSAAKGEVLATYAENLGRARGLSKAEIKAGMKDLILQLDDRIHELADHAGKYATYQDETLLSKASEKLKKGLNEFSTGMVSRKMVEMGLPKSLSMEGFGAGDIVNKFAKTPANLIMRGMDYSPIGFLRSLVDLGYFVGKRERFNQHEAVRTLGRAITGTLGFTGMGYVLADAGILTGSASMDKDMRSIQEQSGQGAYKVNWSALARFVTSGLDYKAAKYEKGDHIMSYEWLQPAAISVAMGVNANKAVNDKKNGADIAGWQVAKKGLLGGLQSVLENPMVQGISNVVDAASDIYRRGDLTKLQNIGKGVPASFVPTLLNQWRTATDNKQRETYSADLLTEMGNLMKNKIPGLSKSLPVSYDSLGNARERLQGGKENTVTQYLTAFFSPARMTEYQVSPEAKLVLDLMDESGETKILPRIGSRSFHVKQGKNMKDLKVSLTAEQFSEFQKNLGTRVAEKLAKQSAFLSNPNISTDKKVDKVTEILTEMGKKAREDIGTQMGYKKKDIKS